MSERPGARADDPQNYLHGRSFAGSLGYRRAGLRLGRGRRARLLAVVFYDEISRAEASEDLAKLGLGHAIAHEIGHLLLRSSAHSVSGVMRAAWGDTERRLAASGCLLFLPEQSRSTRTEVLARMSLQQALKDRDNGAAKLSAMRQP